MTITIGVWFVLAVATVIWSVSLDRVSRRGDVKGLWFTTYMLVPLLVAWLAYGLYLLPKL